MEREVGRGREGWGTEQSGKRKGREKEGRGGT